MTLCWIVDDNGMPHAWHGEPMMWVRWMWEQKGRGGLAVVGRAEWPDGTRVSTVFLGNDMAFGMDEPLFWESMVFGSAYDKDRPQERYTSQRAALNGHLALLERVIRDQGCAPAYREEWIPPEDRLTSETSRITMQGPGTMGAPGTRGEETASGDNRDPECAS